MRVGVGGGEDCLCRGIYESAGYEWEGEVDGEFLSAGVVGVDGVEWEGWVGCSLERDMMGVTWRFFGWMEGATREERYQRYSINANAGMIMR